MSSVSQAVMNYDKLKRNPSKQASVLLCNCKGDQGGPIANENRSTIKRGKRTYFSLSPEHIICFLKWFNGLIQQETYSDNDDDRDI